MLRKGTLLACNVRLLQNCSKVLRACAWVMFNCAGSMQTYLNQLSIAGAHYALA